MFKDLIATYLSNYIDEHGRKKAGEVMEKLSSSALIQENLDRCIATGYVPTVNDLNSLVISAHFMLGFASHAKIGFASAFFLYVLYSKHEAIGSHPDEIIFLKRLVELQQGRVR